MGSHGIKLACRGADDAADAIASLAIGGKQNIEVAVHSDAVSVDVAVSDRAKFVDSRTLPAEAVNPDQGPVSALPLSNKLGSAPN